MLTIFDWVLGHYHDQHRRLRSSLSACPSSRRNGAACSAAIAMAETVLLGTTVLSSFQFKWFHRENRSSDLKKIVQTFHTVFICHQLPAAGDDICRQQEKLTPAHPSARFSRCLEFFRMLLLYTVRPHSSIISISRFLSSASNSSVSSCLSPMIGVSRTRLEQRMLHLGIKASSHQLVEPATHHCLIFLAAIKRKDVQPTRHSRTAKKRALHWY